jgi:TRAP-type C4-dicarboxylate transport system permease small subunit
MKELDKFIGRISSGFSVIAQIALAMVMFLIVANILLRRFAAPIPGTVELAELAGALILGSSIAYCLYSGGHIFVDVLVQRLPLKAQTAVDFVSHLLMLILNCILSWQMFIYGMRMSERGFVTGHLGISIAPVVYVLGVGFILMALVNITHLLNSGRFLIKGAEK